MCACVTSACMSSWVKFVAAFIHNVAFRENREARTRARLPSMFAYTLHDAISRKLAF